MVKKRLEYRSPAILWFLKKNGKVDPEDAVRTEANRLLFAAGLTKPPFEPRRIAHLRKITLIRRANIMVVSQLTPVKGGFSITIKSANQQGVFSSPRDTFSIAHEIGHTLFYYVESPTPIRLHGDLGSEVEERLCDIFAAELLMPEHRFKSDALAIFDRVRSWCETLFELKSLYRVSMRSAAQRVVELNIIEGAVVIKWIWKPKSKTGSDTKLRVDWSVPLRDGKHYFVWPDKPAPDDSVFVRASVGSHLIREKATLKLGALKGDFLVEAKGYESKDTTPNRADAQNARPVLSICLVSH